MISFRFRYGTLCSKIFFKAVCVLPSCVERESILACHTSLSIYVSPKAEKHLQILVHSSVSWTWAMTRLEGIWWYDCIHPCIVNFSCIYHQWISNKCIYVGKYTIHGWWLWLLVLVMWRVYLEKGLFMLIFDTFCGPLVVVVRNPRIVVENALAPSVFWFCVAKMFNWTSQNSALDPTNSIGVSTKLQQKACVWNHWLCEALTPPPKKTLGRNPFKVLYPPWNSLENGGCFPLEIRSEGRDELVKTQGRVGAIRCL